MNEKIKALAEEAKQYAREQMAHPMAPEVFSAEVFQQRFAELIVKECIERCEDIGSDLHSKGSCTGDGALKCAVDLKKHFGVKE